MMTAIRPSWPALAVAVLLAGGATVLVGGSADADPVGGPLRHDGRFVFARIRYADGYRGGGFAYRQDLFWAHDYPRAEQNLMRILEDISLINPYLGPDGGTILMLDDPALFKYPFAYMSEPGYWTLTQAETVGLRNYLLKGGFLIFDDFHDDHWFNLEVQMQKVFPDLRWVELDVSHPVFHSFFDIKSLEFDKPMYAPAIPTFYGLFEDNDPNGRLLSVANYNNDIGEYWEFDGTGWLSIDLTNEAYKLGVNYIMYGLTH
jgi:hypothetical protein